MILEKTRLTQNHDVLIITTSAGGRGGGKDKQKYGKGSYYCNYAKLVHVFEGLLEVLVFYARKESHEP